MSVGQSINNSHSSLGLANAETWCMIGNIKDEQCHQGGLGSTNHSEGVLLQYQSISKKID